MGRIINEQKIIHDNILQHLKNTYTSENRRFQGTPIYVTYYNRNLSSSEQDRTLETIKEIVGAESPNAYNRIENFPLYLVSEISPSYEMDEYGLTTTGSGEAVILPNMIKPFVDDLISFTYMEEDFLFRVTQIEIDRLNGRKFYKIQFSLSQYKQEEAEEKVEHEFVTELENIGTEYNPILERKEYVFIESIDEVIEDLKKFYLKTFMDTRLNVLVCNYNDKLLYNEFLVKFISENNILENSKKRLFGSYYIQNIYKDTPPRTALYNGTIYYALEKNDPTKFKFEDMITFQIQKDRGAYNPFSVDYRDFYRVFYVKGDLDLKITEDMDKSFEKYKNNTVIALQYDDVFGKLHNSSYQFVDDFFPEETNLQTKLDRHIKIIPHNNQFFSNVIDNRLFEDNEEYFLENIIIKYLNKKLLINDDFIEELKYYVKYPSLKEFLLLPCIIFILKNKIKELTIK